MTKSLEKSSKPLALALARPFMRRRRPKQIVLTPDSLRNVLIIKPEKLGDMVITLPLIDALKAAAPIVQIDLVASPKGVAIVADDPRFRTIELYRKQPLHDIAMMRRVRRCRYDATIEMIDDDSTTGLLLSQVCSGRAVRIGANKNRFADYYDFHTNYHTAFQVHAIDRALALLPFLGIDPTGVSGFARPSLPALARRHAEDFLARNGVADRLLVAVNVSAGKPTRVWADENWIALMNGISKLRPDTVLVIISDPQDRARGERILAKAPGTAVHVPDRWSIREVTAVLARMSAVITPDTSIVHLARAFQIPVIGLYPRPAHVVSRWKPYGQDDGVVCSTSEFDIADIAPAAVLAAFRDVLANQKAVGR